MLTVTTGHLAIAFAAFLGMEAVAALTHRYVMHGRLWCWHRSHHEPRTGRFERNDLFALVFALPSIAAIAIGLRVYEPLAWIGIGMSAYGFAYFLVHDGLVHRRLPLPRPRRGYLRRIVDAHHLHHATRTREGAVSFGFLWPASRRRLRAELRARRLV